MSQKAIGAVLWLAVIIAIVALYQTRKQVNEAAESAESESGAAEVIMPQKPMVLGDFELTNTRGETVTKADVLGKPAIFAFIFTRCTSTCPPIVMEMKKLHDKFADTDVRLFTVTIDPEFDTVEQLGKFADIYEPDLGRWQFLTGDKAAIHDMITSGFNLFVEELFGKEAKPGFEFAHTNRVVLIDAQGRPVKTYLILNEIDRAALYRVLRGKDPFPEPLTGQVTLRRGNGETENLSADKP